MPRADYPPFRGPRLALSEAKAAGGGPVAGRLHVHADGWSIQDASADIRIDVTGTPDVADGDWVSGTLERGAAGPWLLAYLTVHAPHTGPSPDPDLTSRLPALRLRAAILEAARACFREQGFLEVETPTRVPCPGLEPHLVAFPAGAGRYLITSPELHLKRLLAAGAERIVEFARAFRDDEIGPWHRPEFTLLEWYRAFAGLADLEADCERLVAACAAAPGIDTARALPRCNLTPPFDRVTVREALQRATGLDLPELGSREALGQAVSDRGHEISLDDSWDDLFFRVWIAEVEPGLGRERPIFVCDYPASQAALARKRREPWGEVAERFELYIDGVELANAFCELNDPIEQRRRHEADRAARAASGSEPYPLDEAFLGALAAGMPPASGIALGFDRLVALLTGVRDLARIHAF